MARITNKTMERAQARVTVAEVDQKIAKIRAARIGENDPVKRAKLDLELTQLRATRQDANRVLRGKRRIG